MTRRRLIGIVGVIVLVAAVGYLGAGTVVYNQLTNVTAKCGGRYAENTPLSFTTQGLQQTLDTRPYLMKSYEEVSFPSRGDAVTLSAWYVPALTSHPENAPAVIVVHGVNDCKRSPAALLAAGMLNRNGFNVLLVDLRNMGDSQKDDGRYAGGTKEYRDVLGAWDWLIASKGIPAQRIGLFGYSLGAGTVMIATGEEPRIAATWEDSGYADIEVAIQAELKRNHYPAWLEPGGILIGKLMTGNDLSAHSPLEEIGKLNGRPFFITHGDADQRLSVQYAYDLAAALRAQGRQIEPWILHGSGHVGGMFDYPVPYENRLVTFFSKSLGLDSNFVM